MNLKECFELLGIPEDYNNDDFEAVVSQAFAEKVLELKQQSKNGDITTAEFHETYGKLFDAKETLINSRNVAPVAPTPGQQTGADVASRTESKSGKGVKYAVGAVIVAAAIGVAGLVGYHLGLDKSEAEAMKNNVGIVSEYSDENLDQSIIVDETIGTESTQSTEATEAEKATEATQPTEAEKATEATQPTEAEKATEATQPTEAAVVAEEKVMVMNYGDISDEALVTQRATEVATQLGDAGVINMNTGLPYTVEEIVRVNKFMCGAYIPEVEQEAYSMVNDYLNFCLMDSELTIAFANVNGIDWDNIEDPAFLEALRNTDLPNLQRLQQNTPKIEIVDNMLYGDVSVAAYNYLKMFETKYQEMIYSTDQKLCDDIYLDLTYSLTRLRVNGEYTFTWNDETYTVTMNDFSGRDKVNAGNILQYYAFMYQTAFSKIDEAKKTEFGNSVYAGIDDPSGDVYTYTYVPGEVHGDTVEDSEHYIGYNDENISLDSSVNYAEHKYFETTEFFNAICYSGLRLEDIALDDEGYVFLLGDQQAQNFSMINQINSINAALSNYYAQNLDYYNQTFNKTLTK